MNNKKYEQKRIFVLTLILVFLVVGCFTFVNQVKASTSTGFKNPSTCSGSWSNPERAYDDDGTGHATSDSSGEQEKYGGYGFTLPSSASIASVYVRMDTDRPNTVAKGDDIKLEVSVDGGTTFLATSITIDISEDPNTYYVDVTSWTTWTVDKINNDKIWVRVTHVKDGALVRDVYLDWIPITVSYNILTTTTTSLSESTISLGDSLTCTASVTQTYSSSQPTGIVIFYARPDGGLWFPFDSKSLTDGSATSNAYTPTSAGKWYFKAVYGGDSYFAGSSSGETDAILKVSSIVTYADSDWPMFRGDPTHSGYSTSTEPSTNPTFWTYDPGFTGMISSPAVVDGLVYVGSQNNNVYALDAATGAVEWSYYTAGTSHVRGVSSSPAVVDGVVYVGSDYHYFYALDATTGELKWSYDIGGVYKSSPVVDNGVVYIGSTGGGLYAFDTTTGVKKWNYTTGGSVSSPAVVDGVVYAGSGDFNVYAFNALTGALKWSYPTGYYVYGSPAVVDGVVYIGSTDNKVYALNAETGALKWSYATGAGILSSPAVVDGVVYIGSTDYKVYALNATTGAEKWSYATGGRIESSPAVANGVVYVGSDDWSVYGLDSSTGAKLWSYSTGSPVRASPAFAGGVVYISAYDGQVFAINAGTSVKVHLTINSENGSPTSTSTGDIGQGTVVTVSVSSIVNGPTGVRYVCTGWTGTGSVPASGTGTSVTFTIMEDSSITWNWKTQYYLTVSSPYGTPGGAGWYDTGKTTYATLTSTAVSGAPYIFTGWGGDTSGTNYLQSNSITMNGPKTATANWVNCNPAKWIQPLYSGSVRNSPEVANNMVYVGASYMLFALDTSTGTQKWLYHTGATSGGVGGVSSSPTVVDGVVYCGSDGPSRNVIALNAVTGAEIWTYEIPSGVGYSSPAVANGVVYIGSPNCNFYALDAATGVKKWIYTTGAAVITSPAVANGIVYFGSQDHKVYALDAETGALKWSYTTGHQIDYSSPAVVNGVVYIGSDDCKVYALDATTGAFKWSYTTGGLVQSSPTVADGVVYVGSGDGNVYALNSATGEKIWSQVTGYVRTSPAVADGVVYVSSINRNIYAFDASTGATLWCYATGDSVYSSPNVVNGVVYVGSTDGNVYAIKAGKWRLHLTVTSAHGSPTPATGDFCKGKEITVSVGSIVNGPTGVRYVCTGWTGTGSVPASGTGVSVTFTIMEDSSITWNWKTQYQVTFAVSPSGAGSTTPSTPPSDPAVWEDAGPLSISTSANSGYAFSYWSSNTQSITFNNVNYASTTATLNGPGTVIANYIVTNQPPVADANGPYNIKEGTVVNLEASGSSDPDGSIVLYEWDLDNDGIYDDATGITTSYTWLDNGVYTVSLRVTDDDGASDTDTATVTATDLGPTASFSDNGPKDEGSAVSFTDASTSSPDTIVSWSWDFGDGVSSSDQDPSHTFMDNGVYAVRLTVTDDDGSTDYVEHSVAVNDLGPTAVFNWNPEPQNEGSQVDFTDLSTSNPDEIVWWSWDFAGLGTSTEENPSFTFMDDGVYIVTLTVTDDDRSTDTAAYEVTILNLPPIANAGPDQTIDEGSSVTLDASASDDPGDDPLIYEWDLDNDGEYDDASGVTTAYTWNDDGVYIVGLKVTDDKGGVDTDSTTLTVSDLGPTASFSDNGPKNEGSAVQFTDTSTSYPDTIVVWSWEFGDGDTGNDQNPSHTYRDDGTYTVTLTVTDDDGSIDISSHDVTVVNVPPTVNAGPDQIVDEGDMVYFSGSFTDPGHDTHTFEWIFGDGDTATGTQAPSHTYLNDGTYTVTFTVTDDDGGTDTDIMTVKVKNVAPNVDAGPDVTIDEGDAFTGSGSFSDPGDDSWTATVDYGEGTGPEPLPLSGKDFTLNNFYEQEGVHTVTIVVYDDDTSSSDTLTVTVSNLPPTLDSIGDKSVPWMRLLEFTATATDPGDDKLTFSLDEAPTGAYITPEGHFTWTPTTSQIGEHSFTIVVSDDGIPSFSDSEKITVTVEKHTTNLVYSGDASGEYSNPVTVRATLTDTVTGTLIERRTLYFSIGTQSTSDDTDASGLAEDTLLLMQPAGSPGVDSVFYEDGLYLGSIVSESFTITKENSDAEYTGDTYVFTLPDEDTVPLRLSAKLTQDNDGYPGNLSLAQVVFTIPGAGTYLADVNSLGEALIIVDLKAGTTYDLTVQVDTGNGYWEGGLDTSSLTVAEGTGVDTITGGGWISDPDSINGKGNFGFTVQYNKKNAPKGNFVYIWRGDDGYNYKVKSNSWQGGGLWFTQTGAYFTGKCTFTKIDRMTGEEITLGNCYATMDITDGDVVSPVIADSFAITVLDGLGPEAVILRQVGTPMHQIELGGGNIVIHK